MAWKLDDIAMMPRPVLARRLAAWLGRNFTETISALIKHGDDVDAVARHFHAEDAEGERKAARCRRQAEPPASAPEPSPSPPTSEPIFIMKSEPEPIVVYPLPDNSAVIDEMVSRGLLAPALLSSGRTVYASPGLAQRLSAIG